MTTTPVTDLQPGDVFHSAGSRKQYRVDSIVPAHRAEYTFAVYCTSLQTGKGSTVVWPANGHGYTVEVQR
jgi:hypothetical protein